MTQPGRGDRVLDNVVPAVVLTGASDIATWTVVGPITVARVGVLVTAAQSGAQPVIRFDLRPTYGSDVGRINGKFGAFQFPPGGVAVGRSVSMASNGQVDAGQQIVCAIITVGGAGSVIPFFEWETRSENPANQGVTQVAGVIVTAPQSLMVRELESPEEEEARREREEEEQVARFEAREDALLEHERRVRETPEERTQRRERQAQERRQARAEARQRREQEQEPEREPAAGEPVAP